MKPVRVQQARGVHPSRASAGTTAQAYPHGARFSLAVLRATASDVLTRHVGQHGVCAVCDCPWPCDLVVRAESHAAGM